MAGGSSPDYLKERVERCREDLSWARNALDRGEYRLSLNRAYYAVFHLASAVLSTLGVKRKKHSGVEAAFNELLVKPGLVEAEYARFYSQARRWREEADYEFAAQFTRETAEETVDRAEKPVARLERVLREQGHLPPEEVAP